MSEFKNQYKAIDSLLKLVNQQRRKLKSEPEFGETEELWLKCLAILKGYIKSIRTNLKKKQLPQAYTTVRGMFELSCRLLWGSREDDGWDRLEAKYAFQQKKWAEKVNGIEELKQCAGEALNSPRIQEYADKPKPPKMRRMMEVIYVKDHEENFEEDDSESDQSNPEENGTVFYYLTYSPLSWYTHGHLPVLIEEIDEGHANRIVAMMAHSTDFFLRACGYAMGWSDAKEVRKKIKRILLESK